MSSSESEGAVADVQPRLSRENVKDILWKVAAAILVIFLVYVLLHFGSQLIELQGG